MGIEKYGPRVSHVWKKTELPFETVWFDIKFRIICDFLFTPPPLPWPSASLSIFKIIARQRAATVSLEVSNGQSEL